MIFSQLKLRLAVSELPAIVRGVKINKPESKNYDPGLWKKMQHFLGAHFTENLGGRELLYQVGFRHAAMVSVQINTNCTFTEAGYSALVKISDEIISANTTRGMTPTGSASVDLPWVQLKDMELAASGLPNDRYVNFRYLQWRTGQVHSYLNSALEWPQVLRLEYREETHGT